MANDPLESCRRKVERANEHFLALDKAVQDWGKTYPYGIATEFDSDTGEYVIQIRKLRDAPVVDWGITIGEIVNSLRSALDHLACAMVRQKAPADNCKGVGFPVLLKPGDWDRKRRGKLDPQSGLAKIRGVNTWSERFVKRLQPFSPGQKTGRDNPLWVLNELTNIDKHRTLHVSELFHYSPEIVFRPPDGGEVTWVHPGGPLEDGAEVLRYRLVGDRSEAEVQTNTRLGADIVFDQGSGPAEGMNVFVLLRWLRDYVEWIIDMFGYKFFGGKPPSGLQSATVTATASATVEESAES